MIRPFQCRGGHSDSEKAIPTTKKLFQRRRGHSNDSKAIPTTTRPFRRRQGHSDDHQTIPTTTRPLRQQREHSDANNATITMPRPFQRRRNQRLRSLAWIDAWVWTGVGQLSDEEKRKSGFDWSLGMDRSRPAKRWVEKALWPVCWPRWRTESGEESTMWRAKKWRWSRR